MKVTSTQLSQPRNSFVCVFVKEKIIIIINMVLYVQLYVHGKHNAY